MQPLFCCGPRQGRARLGRGGTLLVLWAAAALVLAAFPYGGMGADDSAGLAGDPGENTATVRVTGVADNGRGDLEEALKRDACRKAIEQAAGFQIVSRTVAFDSLVKTFTDLKAEGFVIECRPLSAVRSQGGTSTREFAVKVRTGLVNQELLAKKIDVRLLYDVVSRPRICVAIEDKIQDRPGAEWDTNRQLSSLRIVDYFRRLNRNFEFLDLSLMRRSTSESLEAVALEQAALNSYDLLVSGTTRIEARAEPNDANPDHQTMFDEPPAPRFRTTVEWRVTEVASKRLALPIQGESSDRALEEGLSKTRFLDKEVAGLFRELMAHWISMAFSAPYKIEFFSSGAADSSPLLAGLKLVKGLDSESIRMSGDIKGRITFSATASEDLAEIRGSLEKIFKDKYRILLAQLGLVQLVMESDAVLGTVSLEVSNLSASRAEDIVQQIKRMESVNGLEQEAFRGGKLSLKLRSFLSAKELGLALEKGVSGLRISDYSSPNETPARIAASWQ
ncbi:MAG: hypothetical protein ACLQM8_19160 [Limisphaerales bacterium]